MSSEAYNAVLERLLEAVKEPYEAFVRAELTRGTHPATLIMTASDFAVATIGSLIAFSAKSDLDGNEMAGLIGAHFSGLLEDNMPAALAEVGRLKGRANQ